MQEKQLEKLKNELASAPRNARGRRQYGNRLQTRVVRAALEARVQGQPVAMVAEKLGIRGSLVGKWVRGAQNKEGTHSRVRRVEVVQEPRTEVVQEPSTEDRLTLHLSHDARVEGLTVAEISVLLRCKYSPSNVVKEEKTYVTRKR